MAKYVTQYDAVWKLSNTNFKVLEQKIERREEYDLDKLGKCITTKLHHALDMVRAADDIATDRPNIDERCDF